MTNTFQSLPSRQLHLRPGSPLHGVLEGRAGRRPGVFGVVHVDHTLRPLRRITRLIGGMFTRSTFPNQSGSLAKGISDLASPTAPNIPNLRLGRRVLEGREMVAGGETTGPCGAPMILTRRAPAGAREACGDSISPSSAHFSRPSRALPSPTAAARRNPVVAPPAHISRASGTMMNSNPTPMPR